MDSILCKESNKCLFYNAFIHTIQSATKNKAWTINKILQKEVSLVK